MLKRTPFLMPKYAIVTALAIALSIGAGRVKAVDFGEELPVVKKIIILGNRSFDDKVLKKRMRTKEPGFLKLFGKPRYRRDILRRDIESIRSLYNRNGYFEAQVSIDALERDQKHNNVTIRIMINEGPQTVVRSLAFDSTALMKPVELRKGLELTEGRPFNPNLVEVDRYALFGKFFERGYLGAMVSPGVTVDSTKVDVSWKFEPGNPIKIDSIMVKGNSKVSEALIMRELRIHKGEYFNLGKVVASKQNLYDTGCFSSVEIEPKGLDALSGRVDLHLQVRERKMGYFETGLGAGNVHANRVFAEWGQRNLLGRGYALKIKTDFAFSLFKDNEYSFSKMDLENKYIRYQGELHFPHVFSTWNTFSLGASYERDATVEPAVIEAVSYNGTVSRRFSRQTSLLAGYFFETIRRKEVVDEKAKSRRRSIDLTFRRDTRDFYFSPKRGSYVGMESRLAGGVLGGEDHYFSLIPSYQKYELFSREAIFAYRIRVGYARAFGESRETGLPIESRFFVGGGNSVRGYLENSLGPAGTEGEPKGGDVMLLTNAELRFPLPWLGKYNLGAVLFLDGGNSWESFKEITMERFRMFIDKDDVTAEDYRFSAGFGLRYYTPVGPIRADFGFPIVRTPEDDYGYRIHISLGQIF
ncbi:MAG: outer membrane protein assembly factor BamA [Candidatus Dadabacteria bacterium]|nr:outer membrane protein assembly factor BamA [Candidatus Dadabacteria bacterium]